MSGAAELERIVPASTRGCPARGPDGRPWCVDYGIPCGGRDLVRVPRLHCPWCPWDDREYHPTRWERLRARVERALGL